MEGYLPIIISVCALVLSIISPVLSAWLNGRYRIKEKKLDLMASREKDLREVQVRHKMEVIEEYVRAVGELSKYDNLNKEVAYGAVSGQIYLYVDKKYWPLLADISEAIKCNNLHLISDKLSELCQLLATDNIIGSDYEIDPDKADQ